MRLGMIVILFSGLMMIYFAQCTEGTKRYKEIFPGENLARTHCSSCHLYPEPGLLNKQKWKIVLPQMGLRLGIKSHLGENYDNTVKSKELFVPDKPMITPQDWQKILDFYYTNAPVSMPAQQRSIAIEKRLPFFSIEQPSQDFFEKQLLATFVRIDTTVKPARVFVADGWNNKFFVFNSKLMLVDSIATPGPVVDMTYAKGQWFVCIIGKVLGANDEHEGLVKELIFNSSGLMHWNDRSIFDHLARPVQIIAEDLNGDHRIDYLIAEFGNINGMLCWMENKGNGQFEKHILSPLPGALKIYIRRSGKNDQPEIWALFAQGKERISRFINKGSGKFEEQVVLQFAPIYGSSSFELVDLNRDGYPDIVYTCGDNGDGTPVLKPYHGMYVFINNGTGNFKQAYFYPINGCYKALARDFENNGNIDIATVSVYTDSRQREEGFIFFKNAGNLLFKPYAMPGTIKFERGITMDAADLSGTGRPDILIGSAFFDFGPFGFQQKEPLFYLLRNQTKQKN